LHAIACAKILLALNCLARPAGRLLDSRLRGNERRLWLALLIIVLTTPVAHAVPSDLIIPTPDGERLAIVIPSGAGPRPTVIVLHDAAQSAGEALATSGFARQAKRRGYNVVYPQGVGRQWNDLRRGGAGGADDVAFLQLLMMRLIDKKITDFGKIFVVGIGTGGTMSLTMACRASAYLSGVATIVASMPDGLGACHEMPLAFVMVAATADPVMPYAGGEVGASGGGGFVRGVEETANLFAARNGCGAPALAELPDADKRDESTVTRLTWSNCAAPLMLYRIERGGHQIPGTGPYLPLVLGATNQDISAAEVIMDFFARAP
jgi:polyhydroxybutyrate depolymerase